MPFPLERSACLNVKPSAKRPSVGRRMCPLQGCHFKEPLRKEVLEEGWLESLLIRVMCDKTEKDAPRQSSGYSMHSYLRTATVIAGFSNARLEMKKMNDTNPLNIQDLSAGLTILIAVRHRRRSNFAGFWASQPPLFTINKLIPEWVTCWQLHRCRRTILLASPRHSNHPNSHGTESAGVEGTRQYVRPSFAASNRATRLIEYNC